MHMSREGTVYRRGYGGQQKGTIVTLMDHGGRGRSGVCYLQLSPPKFLDLYCVMIIKV